MFCCVVLFISPDNTSFGQVVGRHLHRNLVSGKDPDVIHAQLSADMSKYLMPILQLYGEHRVGKLLENLSFYFYRVGF